MKREVFLDDYYEFDNSVEVIVHIDKEEIERLTEEVAWIRECRILAGDFIAPLQLVEEILHEAKGGIL